MSSFEFGFELAMNSFEFGFELAMNYLELCFLGFAMNNEQ